MNAAMVLWRDKNRQNKKRQKQRNNWRLKNGRYSGMDMWCKEEKITQGGGMMEMRKEGKRTMGRQVENVKEDLREKELEGDENVNRAKWRSLVRNVGYAYERARCPEPPQTIARGKKDRGRRYYKTNMLTSISLQAEMRVKEIGQKDEIKFAEDKSA